MRAIVDIISNLSSFFNLSKTAPLSLHGFIAASAFAILFWPAKPIDRIHQPTNFAEVINKNARQCAFNDDPADKILPTATQVTINGLRQNAIETQDQLEQAKAQLDYCIALDTSHIGEAEDDVANAEYQIKQLEAERAVLQTQYLAYVKTLSQLRGEYEKQLAEKTRGVVRLQNAIGLLHEDIKRLQLHVDVEKLYLATITNRLAEPGRLRPRRAFDDVLAGLSNHVVAFALLALVLGFVLDPFNRMISTALFDFPGYKILNRLRRRRFTVMRLRTRPPARGPIGAVPAGGGPGPGGPGPGGPGPGGPGPGGGGAGGGGDATDAGDAEQALHFDLKTFSYGVIAPEQEPVEGPPPARRAMPLVSPPRRDREV